jgi:hypothetical protein
MAGLFFGPSPNLLEGEAPKPQAVRFMSLIRFVPSTGRSDQARKGVGRAGSAPAHQSDSARPCDAVRVYAPYPQ